MLMVASYTSSVKDMNKYLVFSCLNGVLCVFALAESLLGFCAGCFVFNYLMAWGVIPSTVCEACQRYAPSTGDDSAG